MLTSRLPQSREEIKYCVSLLKHSPYWRGSSMKEKDVAECWEELLSCGLGLIDIIHESNHDGFLIDRSKALSNPHYEKGHGCLWFDVFVTDDVMKELVQRADDSEDALMYVLRLYNEHRQDRSMPCPTPTPRQDAEGHPLAPEGLNGISVALFHPGIDFSDPQIIESAGSEDFIKCTTASMRHAYDGLKHNSWLNVVAGEDLKPLFVMFGNIWLRDYSDNEGISKHEKKYLFFMATSDAVSKQMSGETRFNLRAMYPVNRYSFLFVRHDAKRRAALSYAQQRVCYLAWLGFRYEEILAFLKERGEERTMRYVISQIEQSNTKLSAKNYETIPEIPPQSLEWNRRVIDESAIHEIREFIFPMYRWPMAPTSRRWSA